MPAKSIELGGQPTEKTTAPVKASPANDAEFCDSPGAFARFGLRRSLLYDLYAPGPYQGRVASPTRRSAR